MPIKLEDYPVNTAEAASILGVPAKTFSMWRQRNGLLPKSGGGRGFPLVFHFRDLLCARVAQKLMSIGVPAADACQYVNRLGFVSEFANGGTVKVAFVGGKIGHSANLDEDVFLSFGLENDGWSIAQGIAALIKSTFGKSVAVEALTQFEEEVARIRSSKG